MTFSNETRMHPRVMKVQQNDHKCHAAIPAQKSENSKNSINFFSYSQLPHKLYGFINDCYYVTLPCLGVAKRFDLRAECVAAWPLEGRIQCDLRDLCKIGCQNVL